MTFHLIISDGAQQDISDIFNWYTQKSIVVAENFENEISELIDSIEDNPFKIQVKYQQIRVAFLKKFPHGIHFTIKDDSITIIAVFHTSRNPQKWTGR